MDEQTDSPPIRPGWESVAEAAAELKAWRGDRSLNEAAALVGAKGPQWFEWENCHDPRYARPGGDYREKIELATGIGRARWRTRDEQSSFDEVAVRVAASKLAAHTASDFTVAPVEDGLRVVRDEFSQVEG